MINLEAIKNRLKNRRDARGKLNTSDLHSQAYKAIDEYHKHIFTDAMNMVAEIERQRAYIHRLRTTIERLLLSADVCWYAQAIGHDWRPAVDAAKEVLDE